MLVDQKMMLNKVQNPFMIKKKKNHTQQSGNEGSIPQHNKGHIHHTIANIIFNGQKLKAFPRSFFPLDQEQDKDVCFHSFYST